MIGTCMAFYIALLSPRAEATFIDTDPYCVNYGCLVVGDGTDFAVYDAFIIATNTCCVAANQPLIRWTGGVLVGAGGVVTAVVTGSLVAATVPGANQYTRLGIDTNADGTAETAFADGNANGFLDAGDTQTAFQLTAAQRVALVSRTVSRSVYITSTLNFDLYASAVKATNTGTFGPSINLANVGVVFSITRPGNDGIPYGANAANPNFVPNAAITNLGQISPGPVRVAEFRRNQGIRQNNVAGTNIMPQCVRLNTVYTLPPVNLASGTGAADIDLTLNFYQRP
jgi:hypothetical protein